MKYTFVGKSYVVSEAIKAHAEKKINRLSKFLPETTEVNVTFDVTKLDHKVEVTVYLQKRVLRAEMVDKDMYAAVDKVADVLENQMSKYKDRLKTKGRRDSSYNDEYATYFAEDASTLDDEPKIIKSKRFAIKPMDTQDAIMEMDLIGHSFFVFRNSQSDEVNVVYKRNDGNYGLIEPEY